MKDNEIIADYYGIVKPVKTLIGYAVTVVLAPVLVIFYVAVICEIWRAAVMLWQSF